MLESLAAQLQTLQEVVVLDSDRPLSDLLGRVIDQAASCWAATGAAFTGRPAAEELVAWPRRAAPRRGATMPGPDLAPDRPIVRALAAPTRPVAVTSGEADGALLAVPLLVRSEATVSWRFVS